MKKNTLHHCHWRRKRRRRRRWRSNTGFIAAGKGGGEGKVSEVKKKFIKQKVKEVLRRD